MLKKLLQGALIGLLASAVAVALLLCGWLDRLESVSWDFRVNQMAKPGKATGDIRLILLDQTSLDFAKEQYKQYWPWDRTAYARITDFCKRGGARAIVFDMLFTEPSKSVIGQEDDQNFGTSIASSKCFVASMSLSREQGSTVKWPPEIPRPDLQVPGLQEYLPATAARRLVMPKAIFPLPEISTNCSMLGNVFHVPDADGKTRRVAPFRLFNNQFIPSLGLAAFLAGNHDSKVTLKKNGLQAGQYFIPMDKGGRTILNYRGTTRVYKSVNATAVLNSELRIEEGKEPEIDPAFFNNTYVFFGVTAPGLMDLKPTPISKVYPGAAVHATMLDNILSNDLIRDPGTGLVILLAVLFGLAGGIGGRFCRNGVQSALIFIVLLPLPVIMGFAAYSRNIWLHVSAQEVASALALISAAILNYATEGKQKRFIKTAFKQYLSSEVIEKLVRDPEHLKLGGETRELSIFFSDVGGFTGISEVLTPEQLTALLNEYLTAMTDIIYSEGGTIDKYEGDAIIAFWNAPLDLPDHPGHAVKAALRCNRKLAELRPVLKEKYGRDLFARIGINTGPVVVGNMGSIQRFNYTFLGDAGNLASRLEGQNKKFGTSIMISENTFKLLGDDIACREISTIRVVGKKIPIKVYEPMFREDFTARSDLTNSYSQALQLYYKGQFKEALEAFTRLSSIDPPSAAYAERCKDLIENPPKNWDGVWEMKEK